MLDLLAISTFDNLDQDAYYQRLKQYASIYYNSQNAPVKKKAKKNGEDLQEISDETWDTLLEGFEARFGESYADIGAEIEMDGNHQRKTLLPRHMASQSKVKNDLEWVKWVKSLGAGDLQLLGSDKCDGVSATINYYNELVLTTRGNGTIGADISHLLPALKHRLPDPETVRAAGIESVRVELELKDKDFEWIKKNVRGCEDLSNARSCVAGLVNSKTFDPKIIARISVLAYKCAYSEKNHQHKPSDEFDLLKQLNFETPRPRVFKWTVSLNKFEELLEMTKERKGSAPYAIDGMVVAHNVSRTQEDQALSFDWCFGPRRDENCKAVMKHKIKVVNPTFTVAVKLAAETYTTAITGITYSISRFGGIFPTIHFETVDVGDVNMGKATGKSGRRILTNNLKRGDTILVRRANDVIPEFLMLVKSVEGTWEQPSEALGWKWNATKEDMVLCEPETNEDVLIARWVYFFEELKAKHVGEMTVEKLYHFFKGDLAALLKATPKELRKIDGFKDGLAAKVHESIQGCISRASLVCVMKASCLFGAGLGQTKIGDIMSSFPGCLAWKINSTSSRDKRIEQIQTVKGIMGLAVTFIDNLPRFQDWLKSLPMISIEKIEEVKPGEEVKSNGMVVVFSGKRDKDAAAALIKHGGVVGNSVTNVTTHLVMDTIGTNSSKEQKALEKGIAVMTMMDFKAMLAKM